MNQSFSFSYGLILQIKNNNILLVVFLVYVVAACRTRKYAKDNITSFYKDPVKRRIISP